MVDTEASQDLASLKPYLGAGTWFLHLYPDTKSLLILGGSPCLGVLFLLPIYLSHLWSFLLMVRVPALDSTSPSLRSHSEGLRRVCNALSTIA